MVEGRLAEAGVQVVETRHRVGKRLVEVVQAGGADIDRLRAAQAPFVTDVPGQAQLPRPGDAGGRIVGVAAGDIGIQALGKGLVAQQRYAEFDGGFPDIVLGLDRAEGRLRPQGQAGQADA